MGGQSSEPGKKEEVVRIMCPKLGCQRILAVPIAARGKLVRCRTCGSNIRVPANAPERRDVADGADGEQGAGRNAA